MGEDVPIVQTYIKQLERYLEIHYLPMACPVCGRQRLEYDRFNNLVKCEKCGTENWKAPEEAHCNLSYVELEYASLKQSYEIEQILGKALGYPKYKDDPKNFPDATDDSVCVGDHVPESLALEAACRIEALERDGRCVPVDVDLYGFTKAEITPPPTSIYHPRSGEKFVAYRVVLKPRSPFVTIRLGGGREIRVSAWANKVNILGPACEHQTKYEKMLDAAQESYNELRERLYQTETELDMLRSANSAQVEHDM